MLTGLSGVVTLAQELSDSKHNPRPTGLGQVLTWRRGVNAEGRVTLQEDAVHDFARGTVTIVRIESYKYGKPDITIISTKSYVLR